MTEHTACRRCRVQKLRCDRQQPHCARCTRVGATCSYPDPPDRKLIAARRRAPKKDSRSSIPTTGLTAADQELLIDLYFKYQFKASLIYHRPSLETACRDGLLPHHSLLAIYAFALNFLDPETSKNTAYREQLKHLGVFRQLAEQYALTAGKEVLKDIDEPSVERFQTCHNLGYFWFSRGDTHRNATFSGIAYRASRSQLLAKSSMPWLEDEQARRSFWCSYIQACVNSDDYVIGSASDSLALETALPMSNSAYYSMIPAPTMTLAEMLDKSRPQGEYGVWAYFFGILALWTSIRDHIAARRKLTTNQILYDALILQQDLDNWVAGLPSHFTYTKRNLFSTVYSGEQQIYTMTHAMHHYCRLALHSSLVPKFSENAPRDLSQDAIKISTEATIRNAQSLTELASDVITFECDFTQLPPYMGYCMYIAGSVHLTMIHSKALGDNAKKQLGIALAVLQGMRPFWAIVQHLWTRLLNKCEEQVARGALSSDILPDQMTKPMATYSLLKLKKDDSNLDIDDVLNKISPKEDHPETLDQQLTEMFDNEPLDFDSLAAEYGDDWWQFDMGSLEPVANLEVFV